MASSPKHPELLTIGFRDIPIVFAPLKAKEDTWGTHVVGSDGIEITLEETLEGLEQLQTSVHEMFHGCVQTYIPAGTTRNLKPGEEAEECYVDALATGLVQVLRDNPDYLEYLYRSIKESL